MSVSELQNLLMEETKKLTTAIRDGVAQDERTALRKRIQDIQRLLSIDGLAEENTSQQKEQEN